MVNIILKSTTEAYQLSIDDLKGLSRETPLPEARRMAAGIMFKFKITPKEIAHHLNRSRSQVYRSIDKMVDEIFIYENVGNKFKLIHEKMLQKLEEERDHIEAWLKNNPEAEWQLRFDKMKELEEINNQINDLK